MKKMFGDIKIIGIGKNSIWNKGNLMGIPQMKGK